MENVLSILLNMEKEKSKTIVFRYGTSIRGLNRNDLFKFLLKESVKNFSNKSFYNSTLKAFYHDAYDFIIKHFDEINCIQIYKDNAIQLWSGDRCLSKLIVFEDYDFCNDTMTSIMLKELIAFAEQIS